MYLARSSAERSLRVKPSLSAPNSARRGYAPWSVLRTLGTLIRWPTTDASSRGVRTPGRLSTMGTSLSEGNRRIAMCHLDSTLPMMAKGKIFTMQQIEGNRATSLLWRGRGRWCYCIRLAACCLTLAPVLLLLSPSWAISCIFPCQTNFTVTNGCAQRIAPFSTTGERVSFPTGCVTLS